MMKKKLLITLIASVLLTSCNNLVTYKITVNESEHFYPINASLTFEKGHFNPIELKYTTDSNYAVYSVSALPEGSAICTVENDGKVMITPQQNVDFTITAETRLKDDFAHITFNQDEHFHPFKSDITLNWGALQNIKVGYTYDADYRIKRLEVTPSNAASVTFDNKYIYISPQRNIDFSINVVTSDSFKMIDFDPGEGELDPEASSSAKFYYGKTWGELLKEEQRALYAKYDFSGWSFTPGGFGEVIPFDYVIDESTPSTVYASYVHQVNMISFSLSVGDVYYSETRVKIPLKLVDSQKYIYPPEFHKEYFEVTNSSGETVSFDYLYAQHEISISNRSQIADGLINIKVNDLQPTYSVSFELSNHLEITHEREDTHAKRGDTFVFDVQVKNDTNASQYYIPYEIDVKVGSSTLNPNAYKIESYDVSRQKAKITISGEYVTDVISIKIDEVEIGCYCYEMNGFGVKPIKRRVASDTTNPITLDIVGIEGYEDISEITTRNVFVKYYEDNYFERWASYENFNKEFNNGLTLSVGDAKLIIGTSCLEKCAWISIYISNPIYNIFDNSSWSEIEQLAYSGFADEIFHIGQEKKNIIVDGQNYTARIIDFYHNEIYNRKGEKAPITFEFKEVITDADGKMHEGKFGLYKKPYSVSDYCEYLDGTFKNELPSDMLITLKEIIPVCREGEAISKVFALSGPEIGRSSASSEGFTYKYYAQDGINLKRYTCTDTEHTSPCEYWTRTRRYTYESQAGYVGKNGSYYSDGNVGTKRGYIAAFCI